MVLGVCSLICIKLFGEPKVIFNKGKISIDLSGQTSVQELIYLIFLKYPELGNVVGNIEDWGLHLLLIVNGKIATKSTIVVENDEVILTTRLGGG